MAMCMRAIQLASKDPERVQIPWVDPRMGGDDFHFAWGHSTRMLRMRNGLGLEVAASGSCTVSRARKTVTSLTIDGQRLL